MIKNVFIFFAMVLLLCIPAINVDAQDTSGSAGVTNISFDTTSKYLMLNDSIVLLDFSHYTLLKDLNHYTIASFNPNSGTMVDGNGDLLFTILNDSMFYDAGGLLMGSIVAGEVLDGNDDVIGTCFSSNSFWVGYYFFHYLNP